MAEKNKLIMRLYRVTTEHDRKIKSHKRRLKISESEVVRRLVENSDKALTAER